MWIEKKEIAGLVGPARIGWVTVRNKGKRLDYGTQSFNSLNGAGFKTNYRDSGTGEEYWISGCRRDGLDALYGTTVEIDDDALEEYWVNIRQQPENRSVCRMTAMGKNK